MPALVGARAKSVAMLDNYPVGYYLSPRGNKKYEYTTTGIEVQLSQYYREAVRDGSLIAADSDSAKLCGVEYVEIKEALANAAEKAAKHCFAGYGMYPNWYVEAKPEVKAKPAKELKSGARQVRLCWYHITVLCCLCNSVTSVRFRLPAQKTEKPREKLISRGFSLS